MAISIPELEQRAALGWRAPEEDRLGDWLLRAAGGFTAIEVAAEHRRRGLATVITAALAARAVARSARHLYLQVEDGNEATRGLYQRLGFTTHHGYHYRVAPDRPDAGRLTRLSGADAAGHRYWPRMRRPHDCHSLPGLSACGPGPGMGRRGGREADPGVGRRGG